jgi:predicted secreted protein
MEYTLLINQALLIEWDLNFTQYAIAYIIAKARDWSEQLNFEGKSFYYLTKSKIYTELPILRAKDKPISKEGTDKPNDSELRKIKRAIGDLIKKGIIEKYDLNINKTYYRMTDSKGAKIYDNYVNKAPKKGAEIFMREEKSEDLELFEQFWFLYPRHSGKEQTKEKFLDLDVEDKQKAIDAVKIFAEQQQGVETKFILLAKNWLDQKMYLDYENTPTHDEFSSTKEDDWISEFVYKIRQCVAKYRKLKDDERIDFLNIRMAEMVKKDGDELFEDREKQVLYEIAYDVRTFDELEYQEGEIEIHLRDYLQ